MSFTPVSYGDELSDIAVFVNDVCDEIVAKGKRNITRTDLEASIEGNIGKIAKYIGIKIGANGKAIVSNTEEEYEGLPYDTLSEQMTDSRSCKRALSKQLIEERNKVTSKLESLFSNDLKYVEWPNTRSKFVVGTSTLKPSCPDDVGSSKSIVKIKIYGHLVELNVDRLEFDAKLSKDRKTILAKAQVKEDDGITTFSDTEIKLRNDGEIEGELPWVWKDKNGNICTGTDIITDVKKQARY